MLRLSMSNESPETRSDLNHQEIDGGVEHSEGAERETMPTTSNNMGNFRITPIGFIGLIVCLTGCIGSFLFGSLLTILSWTIGGGVRGMELHEVGSVLLSRWSLSAGTYSILLTGKIRTENFDEDSGELHGVHIIDPNKRPFIILFQGYFV